MGFFVYDLGLVEFALDSHIPTVNCINVISNEMALNSKFSALLHFNRFKLNSNQYLF